MSEQKEKAIKLGLRAASYGVMALVAAYFLYVIFVRKGMGPEYKYVIYAFLISEWLISDVLSAYFLHYFEGHTEEQINAYKLYAVVNMVGMAGLGLFATTVGSQIGLLGAVAYVATMGYKRKLRDQYNGIVEEQEEETVDEVEAPETPSNKRSFLNQDIVISAADEIAEDPASVDEMMNQQKEE